MKVFKKVITLLMIAALITGMTVIGTISPGASGTGTGLAEWAMRAYNEGWSYVWGGDSVGAVDCSGMITSYCGGNRTSMLADAKANGRDWGYVSSGVPNIHGLGLSRPNHVGVYVGNGMEVDARGSDYGVCYQAVGDRWECWFKLTAVSYPTTGWQKFNGDYYYYENGEYITDTTRTIDGETYYFGSDGVSSSSPSSTKSSSGKSTATTTTSTAEDNGVLKKGSTGTKVKELQARLQELGYYTGSVDGDFGEMTEKAFKLFQKQVGLYEDGIAGSDADYLYAEDAPSYTSSLSVTGAKKAQNSDADEDAEDPDAGSDDEDAEAEEYAEEDEDEQVEAEAETKAKEKKYDYAVGDDGEGVVAIQEQLIKLGYLEGEADGAFGSMTESAVMQFQSYNRIKETGKVNKETYEAMFSGNAIRHAVARATEAEEPTVSKVESVAATTAKNTTVERDNAALSQKAVAGITSTVASNRSSSTTNFEFIVWLGIMIVVMLITFAIVFAIEKKRARKRAAAYSGRRFQ